MSNPISRMKTVWGIALIAAFGCAAAGAANLTIGQGTANRGEVAEVNVNFTGAGEDVSTLVVVLKYDPEKLAPAQQYYESIQTDVTGQPLRDNLGNVLTQTSSVKPGAVALQAERLLQTAVHAEEGVLAVAIWGDVRNLVDGGLLTAAFQVLNTAAENESLPITGVLTANPISVYVAESATNEPLASSAAGGVNATAVTLTYTNGMVKVGCTPSDIPPNVTATNDRTDEVLVTWSPVANGEYRVYRSNSQDSATAQALGTQWTTDISFADITASAPALQESSGCFGASQYVPVTHYYWVKSRTVNIQCESAFSSQPTPGYRCLSEDQMAGSCAGSKSAPAAQAGFAASLPRTPGEAGNLLVSSALSLGFCWTGIRMRRRVRG